MKKNYMIITGPNGEYPIIAHSDYFEVYPHMQKYYTFKDGQWTRNDM